MASGITTAFWGMTINNYDDTELALVRNGYPDYLREIVHTLEVGEEGTPHIQAWLKLQRQQRLSFVKKLFPRGHFRPLTSDVYIANTKEYAQKLDDTAVGSAVHTFNDPMNTIESVMKKVIRRMYDDFSDVEDMDIAQYRVQKAMVIEDYKYAKIFVSSTYKQMWRQYGSEMYECLFKQFQEEAEKLEDTHTHTHSDEIFSVAEGIDEDGEDGEDAEDDFGESQEDDEGDDEGETCEGLSTSEGDSDSDGEECDASGD